MNFTAVFTKNDANYVAIISETYVGLSKLREARSELGVCFPSEIMQGYIALTFRDSITINISESFAEKSGHFLESYQEKIIVTPNINAFYKAVLKTKRDSQYDTLEKVYYEYELDEQALLNAWEAAGFPLEWSL